MKYLTIICVLNFLTFIYVILKYYYETDSKTKQCNIHNTNLKYILQWTPGNHSPFIYLGSGQDVFIKNRCVYKNCYITDDINFLGHHRCYHAVLFNGHEVIKLTPKQLPKFRSSKQKYIFAAMESAHNYPACHSHLDGFFNWTWTYRLDSDARWGYITAYDMKGNIVAPKSRVDWPRLQSVDDRITKFLTRKYKIAAWFVSNCKTRSRREVFAELVSRELDRFELKVDTFGKCGSDTCRRDSIECSATLRNHFFYFAFENSIAEDYVTEKVLTALQNLVVPVVYGGADYSRFLPPGSYLNAIDLDPVSLADTMVSIMNNRSAYKEYFKWWSHFYYKGTAGNEDICSLCALLNDEQKFKEFSVYENFREWWYPNFRNICDVF